MIISFDINEIETFPDEVKTFLKNHIKQRLSSDQMISDQFVPNNNIQNGFTEFAPSFTRHPGRKLVTSKNLDWHELIGLKIEEFDLPIDREEYIKSANAYHKFHQVALQERLWYIDAPYQTKKIVSMMPSKWLKSSELKKPDAFFKNLVLENCRVKQNTKKAIDTSQKPK